MPIKISTTLREACDRERILSTNGFKWLSRIQAEGFLLPSDQLIIQKDGPKKSSIGKYLIIKKSHKRFDQNFINRETSQTTSPRVNAEDSRITSSSVNITTATAINRSANKVNAIKSSPKKYTKKQKEGTGKKFIYIFNFRSISLKSIRSNIL